MSGGSHNYICYAIAEALDIPSGHYGYIGNKEDMVKVRKCLD